MDKMHAIVRRALDNLAAETEEMIKAAMAAHNCGVGDLLLEIFPDGTRRVRFVPPEEKWLNWQSDNHGWQH